MSLLEELSLMQNDNFKGRPTNALEDMAEGEDNEVGYGWFYDFNYFIVSSFSNFVGFGGSRRHRQRGAVACLLGLVELDCMEREYVRCLDRSDWLTLAFSFHKLDSNIILRKSGPPKLFQPGRETRLQDCWWTKDHQVSFTPMLLWNLKWKSALIEDFNYVWMSLIIVLRTSIVSPLLT